MSKKETLDMLDSDSGSDSDELQEESKLSINKKFAARYESESRFKDLQRAKEVLNDAEDEDSEDLESEDEDANMINTGVDVQIIKTINSIRRKDPSIYDSSKKWFDESQKDSDEDEEKGGKSKKERKKEKSKKYKDVIREQLLSDGADLNAEDDIPDKEHTNVRSFAYDEEQRKIRDAFLASTNQEDSDDNHQDGDNDSDDDSDDLMTVKKKSSSELAAEEKDLQEALSEMNALTDGQDSDIQQRDTFLTDFIRNKKWIDEMDTSMNHYHDNHDDGSNDDNGPSYGSDIEKEEEELDRVDAFESKYNFRFEEAQGADYVAPTFDDHNDGSSSGGRLQTEASHVSTLLSRNVGHVAGHARNTVESVRRTDDRRKKAREEKAERKLKEKRRKEEELKRLKNLKRQELYERLSYIQDVSGLGDLKKMGVDERMLAMLDEDWDESNYEQMMNSQFDDTYYEEQDDTFDKREVTEGEDEQYQDYKEEEEEGEGNGERSDSGKRDKKKNKKNKKGEAKGEDASVYEEENEEGHKHRVKALLEELQDLEYEGASSDTQTRFRYREVEPESYGLETEEILQATEKELNSVVGLRKISAYYEDVVDASKLGKKRKRMRAAMRERLAKEAEEAAAMGLTLKGIQGKIGDDAKEDAWEAEDKEEAADGVEVGAEGGKKKRKRRKGAASKEADKGASSGGQRGDTSKNQKKEKKKEKKEKKKDSGKNKAKTKQSRLDLYT